ncbi:MAG: helix-turn-helix transcriptional regulator [Magnetococcales bacterium]|nr:helix-turn-helix transcriptional regulator [Magnetococcales bacterium]
MNQLTPFGRMVRKIRIDQSVRLKEMAEHLGVSSAFLSAVEMGKKNIPEGWVQETAKFLHMSLPQAEELQKLAMQSAREVKICLEGQDDLGRGLTAAFARRLPELSPEDKERISQILNLGGKHGGI